MVEVNIADKMDANRPTTRGIVTISEGEQEVVKVNIADKMDAVRPTTSGKKVLCSFFLFENPDDILPDMDCGFEASNGHMLGEHLKKEHPNVRWINAQDLFRELWESQNKKDEMPD